ncbi:MAG: six-cysteine ranthipeptide SCIFF [Bacteroidota bacterium]
MKHLHVIREGKAIQTIRPECGECQTSCQSACKTSCTVGNQVCQK